MIANPPLLQHRKSLQSRRPSTHHRGSSDRYLHCLGKLGFAYRYCCYAHDPSDNMSSRGLGYGRVYPCFDTRSFRKPSSRYCWSCSSPSPLAYTQ
jgi:hypothetical protein